MSARAHHIDRPASARTARPRPGFPGGGKHLRARALLVAFLTLGAATGHAGGRLAGTGGLAEIEGAGGGGLTPWALITGAGTDRELGGDAYLTSVSLPDYALLSYGLAVGIDNRAELSLARQQLSVDHASPGLVIHQTTLGAKWRLWGDAVVDQDRWWPQVALGAQLKHNEDYDGVPRELGARRATGVDGYLAFTKLLLAGPFGRTWLANGTLRLSEANQFGLLGFGGDRGGYRLLGEASLVVFLSDSVAVGAEFRQKPDNLRSFRENDCQDAVITWLPGKHWSVTAAYARLGNIANHADQRGTYASLQWVW